MVFVNATIDPVVFLCISSFIVITCWWFSELYMILDFDSPATSYVFLLLYSKNILLQTTN